jgi:hypothetical protein
MAERTTESWERHTVAASIPPEGLPEGAATTKACWGAAAARGRRTTRMGAAPVPPSVATLSGTAVEMQPNRKWCRCISRSEYRSHGELRATNSKLSSLRPVQT